MAKTKGALFSLRASGTIGKLLTYQGRRFFRHCHKKALPTAATTAAQAADRALFALAVQAWHGLSPAEKTIYDVIGKGMKNIPGFNAYISIYKNRAKYWTKFGQARFGTSKKFGGP